MKVFPDPLEMPLLETAGLYLRKELINEDTFKEFKGVIKKFDLLIDISSFNYAEFNLEWIQEFPTWIHKLIIKNNEGKERIKVKMKEEILNGDASKKFVDTFFKFYD
ncbi:hypothetical protein [Priestia megaterium]|uniref:hypothetical protein n=1 Tax=Priestia megaterium TaxID=1404 RepID=UPI001C24C30F|nr:hypothetical protein [Priestia megaterium]MBU8754129.1 hypothetical protein [Priestia megaterium]